MTGCYHRVDIGYIGPRFYSEHPNWPFAKEHGAHMQADIDKDIAAGVKIAPFLHPQFPAFHTSPLCAVCKKRLIKFHIIHGLLWPLGQLINDFIIKEEFHLTYLSLDKVISSFKNLGPPTLLDKLDLASAGQHIPVHCEDHELLGSTFVRFEPMISCYTKA